MPPITIRIRQYAFQFPSRYREGTVLTIGEAKALNQLLAENIRNNVDQWVTKAEAELPVGELIPQAIHSALQNKIASYAMKYEFRAREAKNKPGLIEIEARELAEQEARQLGRGPDQEDWELVVTELMSLPKIQDEARHRAKAKREIAQQMLNELING